LLSEVVMARQPEVFVRSLEPDEAQRLVKITRTTRDRVRLRRAGIVLASVQGRSAAEAAGMFAMKPQYAREVIHAFNEQGFAALDPKWSGGRPRRFGPPVRETVCRVAKTPPQRLVLCVDEFGPLNLQPRPGRGWFPARRAARLRATYNRTGGVRHMFAALDLASGQMFYRFRDRKRWREFLGFLKQLRDRFPTGKLYVVCDNYGPHKKAEVVDWCGLNGVELVFTPSNASWLNWIECEFTALRYFTLDGSDYPSHSAQETAIAGYVRWRNKHAQPKRHFATGSKIRRPDYLPNVA
jgi:hypothetical protein